MNTIKNGRQHDTTKQERSRTIQYLLQPDTDFAAYGRLLQSKWRHKKCLPFAKYGHFLPTDLAKSTKANFITDKIKQLVEPTIKEIRRNGGMIKEPRIWDNLLSSQPLCFNLIGEQA